MVVFAALWMIHEVRGYKASLASWSSLTDSMLQDDLEESRHSLKKMNALFLRGLKKFVY